MMYEIHWAAWALTTLEPVVLALIGLGAFTLRQWIRSKIQHQQLESVLVRLTNAAEVAVRETEQTVVRDLKRDAADGKLSAADAKKAAAAALKTGLLARFWKFIVVGFLAVAGFLKKAAGRISGRGRE